MSKIARVKFIRDKEPNIKALTASSKVLDGALYIATDTGTMWMGTSTTSLMQIKDNINTDTTYTLTKSGNTITLKGSDGSSVNITDSNTMYNNATASAAGLMSAADKSKLNSIATGANKTVVDSDFIADSTNPVQSKVIKSALDGKSNTNHKHVKADITDFPTSMPASDVSAWAKAASKPSYNFSELGGTLSASKISGTISSSNLPSYVDDVLEYDSLSKFPTTGEAGKIYTAKDTNKIYRWSGTAYVVISETIALGTTHSTAGYGDESRAAYNHSTTKGNPHGTSKSDLGLGNVENKSSATIRGELTKANVTTALGYTPPTADTNTHWTTRIVAGAASGTANAETTNGNTHINVTDDNTYRAGVAIKGSGATIVTSDASGNITISSTDTNSWRPVANSLTSTATYQSLSAAQGKILNEKFGSYVPTSRTVNGKALTGNISLSAGDVGAAAASHTHAYLPLSGGTMSGRVLRGAGGNWISARKNTVAYGTTANEGGYNPVVGQKTVNGSWTVGNLYGDERLVFSYDTDKNFNAGTDESNITYLPTGNGSQVIITSSTIGKQSVNYANSAGSAKASDVYAWAKASTKPSYSWTEITSKPTFATVATSGSYNDLINKPTIPSVGNGTVTITQNGTNKGSFTLNQSGNATIALTDTNTNTWRPEEVIVSYTQPSASTCKLWIKI